MTLLSKISTTLMRLVLAMLLSFAPLSNASAVSLIRDAEIEETLRLLADPILRAAGLNPRNVRIIIVDDPTMNAFVAGNSAIFINSGMLMRLDTVPKIQAVIAHEAGHIAAGHVISLSNNRSGLGAVTVGALLAGMAAMSGRSDAAIALATGGAQVANRQTLAHSRAAEASADQSAVRYLARAGVDPKAALEALELFRGQEILGPRHIDPYAQTHPLTSQRLALLRNAVATTRVSKAKPPKNIDYWHARMVAKFEGFTGNPRRTLKSNKTNGEFARYKRAIANFRMSNMKAMQKDIAWLVKARPNDPYYHELNGQFLLAAGKASEAVAAYRRAAKLSKNNEMILTGLGRALLALETPSATREAIDMLEKARQSGFPAPKTYQSLAMGYGKLGQNGRASLAIAEGYALSGRLRDAAIHAKRATGLLTQGTPSWRRANDIVSAAKRVAKQQN